MFEPKSDRPPPDDRPAVDEIGDGRDGRDTRDGNRLPEQNASHAIEVIGESAEVTRLVYRRFQLVDRGGPEPAATLNELTPGDVPADLNLTVAGHEPSTGGFAQGGRGRGTGVADERDNDVRGGDVAGGRSANRGPADLAKAAPKDVAPRKDTAAHGLLQSVILLLTMVAMLAAARFAVPRIVEEIRYSWTRGELRAEYEAGTRGLQNVSLEALTEAYQMVSAAAGPSVVHIDVHRKSPEIVDAGTRRISTNFVPRSDQGSGVVVDDEGHILTNRHVIVEGDEIQVTLSDGRRVEATLVGSDALTDLALLKIDADRLFPITWGNSDRCRVGSPVWAIGSPFGLDQTVTFGIISGKHRMVRAAADAGGRYGAKAQYQDFMQSDVAVNPGNSGGPLVNAKGTLVGINTAIVGETFQGVSFSIPSNVAKQIYERLKESGRVERGWLGVRLAEVPDELFEGDDPKVRGALVAEVTGSGSPAAEAGLRGGDVIRRVNRTEIKDMGHLIRVIGQHRGGAVILVEVSRQGKTMELSAKLGHRPDDVD